MYTITREEAASLLKISTRSIDRYIRSGKLRSQKEWKIVYIHEDDVNNFLWGNALKQEVIIPQPSWETAPQNHTISQQVWFSKTDENFSLIFDKLRHEIKLKDDEIKTLSVQIGKMEEVVKNSISIIDFKKTQFLLEESKNSLHTDLESTKKELEQKQVLLIEEKKLNLILIITSIVLFLLVIIIWIVKI